MAMAIATGNTLLLKPSERVPGATAILAELFQQAGTSLSSRTAAESSTYSPLIKQIGLPSGAISIINGTRAPVQFIANEPRIKAVTFVGGDTAGRYIYETGSKNGKRVQAQMGAKSTSFLSPFFSLRPCVARLTSLRSDHAIVMPDANKNFALNSIVGGAFGAAGQRCMALSTIVTVGDSQHWLEGLAERAQVLKVGSGFDPATEVYVSFHPPCLL